MGNEVSKAKKYIFQQQNKKNLLDYVEKEQEMVDFHLKKLFLSLDDTKESPLFLELLLKIRDTSFVEEQLIKRRKIILNSLNKYKLCKENFDFLYFNVDTFFQRKGLLKKEYEENLKRIISHLYLDLTDKNFNFDDFSYLFFQQKEIIAYDSLMDTYCTEITFFFLHILETYQVINTYLLKEMKEVSHFDSILKEVKIEGDLDFHLFFSSLHNGKWGHFLKEKLEKTLPTEEEKNFKIPASFFYQLKKLKEQYQKTKNYTCLVESPEYETCKRAFFYSMKWRYHIQDDSDDKLLQQLFAKLIKSENLTTLYNFNNLKALKHYHRTKNKNIFTDYFTESDLMNYSCKEFKVLLKKVKQQQNSNPPDETKILKLLLIFGFQKANRLLSIYHINELDKLMKGINTLEEHYKNDEFLAYLFKEDAIFKLKNKFLLSSREEYFIVKMILHKIPTLGQLKSFKETNEIGLTPNIRLIEPYFKFNHSKNPGEFLERAVDIYCQYRDRYTSHIPDLIGKKEEFYYRTMDLQDPRSVFLGDEIRCCLAPLGKAETALLHSLLDSNGRLFGVFYENKLISLSWIWRNNGLLCFDNIETEKKEVENRELGNKLLDIYKEAAKRIYDISKKTEPKEEAITTITLGRNKIDICIPNLVRFCKEVPSEKLKWYTPKKTENLYIKDSQQQQYVLYEDNKPFQNQKNTTFLYHRTRNKPIHFEDMNAYDLKSRIDYCRERAHLPITERGYIYGIINDDYYLGINDKFELEATYFGKDNRGKEEMNSYLSELKENLLFYQQKEKSFQEKKEKLLNSQWKINFNEFISEIEKQSSIDFSKDDFYHGTNLELAISILEQKRITCKFRCLNRTGTGLNDGTTNGGFHVCVTKDMDGNNLFQHLIKNNVSFVLNKDLPIVLQTTLPYRTNDIREIPSLDEFQVKDTIPLSYMEAISIPIKKEIDLKHAKIIREALDIFDVDLPIVDITHKKVLSKSFIDRYATPKKRSS